MLCSSKISNRPDKLLQTSLLKLAFCLVALTITLIFFLTTPEYHFALLALSALLTSFCLILTIKTLDAGEEAISYGGFANEIIRNDFKIRRIENPQGESILQNSLSEDLFKNLPVLDFLEQHLSQDTTTKNNFYRLQTAYQNLTREKAVLALVLHREKDRIFDQQEWFEIYLQPIYLKKTNIFEGPFSIKKIKKETYFYWNIRDITAEKNLEQIFQEERKSTHDFLDYLPVGLYVADKDYNLEYVNHNFAEFLGKEDEQIINKPLKEFLSTNSLLPPRKSLWHGEVHFINSHNEVKDAHVFQTGFREHEQNKVRGVVISELPTTSDIQNKIDHAYDKISWLFNYAPVGIIFINNEGIITDCNPIIPKLFDLNGDEIIGQPFEKFITPEDSQKLSKGFEDIRKTPENSLNFEIHVNSEHKSSVISLYISSMQRYYAAGKSNGNGFVLYLIDATRQKNLEIQFAQAQKMQAVGQLAGGVAHDFNNLLTAMIGFTDLLLQRHGVGDPSFADLIQIKQNANRAAGLVRQLLAFSRKQPLQPKLIDITENFVELSHMLKRILGEQTTLNFYHGNELGYVRVDPVQFSQVIINLAVNAKDAMDGHGSLTISTHTEILSESYQFGDDLIKPGEFVVIEVTDTGCGIPEENLSRIFDPFFSTKQNVVGSGTGLGLAMVYGIVRQTEGFIKVKSKLGQGTTFSIYLPRFENNGEEDLDLSSKETVTDTNGTPILTVKEKIMPPVSINKKIIVGLNVSNAIDRGMSSSAKDNKKIRILFVEDEDSVRTFGIRALKKKGYDVTDCSCAEAALECIEQDQNFNLLITDMVMPGMSGAELTKKIKEKIPDIKVILASGYSEEIVKQELDNFDDFDFITKPYSLGDLTAKVFDVLNKSR